MTKQTDSKTKVENLSKMPKLRFRAFNKEWEEFKLKDIAKMYDGTHQTPKYVQQGIPFYSVENVTANNFSKTKYIAKDIFEKENKRVKIEQGDILMTRIGDIGTAKYIDWNVQASFYVSLALIKPNKSYSGQYIAHYISTNKFQSELWNRTIHVAFPKKINLGEIGECLINIPCSSEQNQIAACLSLIDERIECQRKIIEGLTSFKSAVSKKIFSQELRFKDENGKDFPKWGKYTLGDVLIKNSTKNKEQKYKLVESVSNKHGFINQEEYFEDRIVASKDTSNYYVIQKGYFAYNPSRINVGSLAYKRDENTSIISPLYISFKADTRLDDEFLLSYFFSEQFIKQMNRSFEGSVRNTLSYDNLVKMDILLPCKAEQQKISSFLVTLNNKIDLETALLQQLKLQKQYLLQQLFI